MEEYAASKFDQDKKNSINIKDGVLEKGPYDKDDFSACTSKVRKTKEDESPSRGDISGEVNMEAEITADEIMHAGGIGARDDINSLVPIASDLTDVEERLHDVEDYEDLEDEVPIRHSQPHKDPEGVKEHLGSEVIHPEEASAKNQKEVDISVSDRKVRKYKKNEGPWSDKASEDVNVDSGGGISGPSDNPSVQETSKNIVKDIASVEEEDVALSTEDAYETVDMEASVTSDEVMRAGGFGAKDDISSFLPVATDFTDFEANLRGARDYEDSDEKIDRPGLGWNSKAE